MIVALDISDDILRKWQTNGIPDILSEQDKDILNTAVSNAVELKGILVKDMKMPKSCRFCPINSNGECGFVCHTDLLTKPLGCPLKELNNV